jgi:hypothetical protein
MFINDEFGNVLDANGINSSITISVEKLSVENRAAEYKMFYSMMWEFTLLNRQFWYVCALSSSSTVC